MILSSIIAVIPESSKMTDIFMLKSDRTEVGPDKTASTHPKVEYTNK